MNVNPTELLSDIHMLHKAIKEIRINRHWRILHWFGHTNRRLSSLAYDVTVIQYNGMMVEGARGRGMPTRT